jgi:DNA-directed RNA polymerase omega subunit
LRTDTVTAIDRAVGGDNGNERWPGIVSRFQLVLLAGRRSKQLLRGARPRIPADPLKRRNTSIALEELRRGLLPFRGKNENESLTIPTAIDSVGNTTIVEQAPDFDLPKAE